MVRGWRAKDCVLPDGNDPPGGFASLLERVFALRPETWLRSVAGRETFLWPGAAELVVKRTRGGEPRDFWHERLRGPVRSPARREAENLAALGELGLTVPRPLAWFEESRACEHPRLGGRRARSALVMAFVPHDRTLRQMLDRAVAAGSGSEGAVRIPAAGPDGSAGATGERQALLQRLAELVGCMHRAGWYHRDLYLQHIVLSANAQAEPEPGRFDPGRLDPCLLDVGRARRTPRPRRRWFVKDLAALLASAPQSVTSEEKRVFLRAWLRITGRSSESEEAWVRAVKRKAARLLRHRPRAGELRPDAVSEVPLVR